MLPSQRTDTHSASDGRGIARPRRSTCRLRRQGACAHPDLRIRRVARREQLAPVARSARPGVSESPRRPWSGRPTRTSPGRPPARPRPLVADRLGQPHLPDDGGRRRGRAGRQGRRPRRRGEGVPPSRLVGADRKHTLKVMALDTRDGQCYGSASPTRARSTTTGTSAGATPSPTPVTDGTRVYAYFGSEGSSPTTSAARSSGRPTRRHHDARNGHGHLAVLYENLVILQCDEDGGDQFVHRRARQARRARGVEQAAKVR